MNSKKVKAGIYCFLLILCLFYRGLLCAERVFYIYDDIWHYRPTGWFADNDNFSALAINTEYPYGADEGTLCTEVSYNSFNAMWAGFFAQAKGAWRADITEMPKGLDLSGYTAVEVKAKAGVNPVEVQFGIGEAGDSCGLIRTGWNMLTTDWQTFTINISTTTNMTDVNGLFMVAMRSMASIMATFYIDDIKYIGPGPANINDLNATLGPSPGSLRLNWTAPEGDYTNTIYVVKYSPSYIYNQLDFNNAPGYSQSWIPSVSGTTELHDIVGLIPGQAYYFAIETRDNQGNQSSLSNVYYCLARTAGLGISVEGNVIDLGEMPPGASKSGGPLIITNIGGIPMTAALKVTGTRGWTADSDNSTKNHYILLAAFASSEGAIPWNIPLHVLTTESVKSTATRYAGDQSGANIPVDAMKNLWIRFTAPLFVDIGTNQQEMLISITAESVD